MATYVYYEGCGYESEPFESADDDAAEAHVAAVFRNPADPDHDGDEGGLKRIEHDGERVLVAEYAGENMIPDPFNERRSYRG